jgi:hypothetical protein
VNDLDQVDVHVHALNQFHPLDQVHAHRRRSCTMPRTRWRPPKKFLRCPSESRTFVRASEPSWIGNDLWSIKFRVQPFQLSIWIRVYMLKWIVPSQTEGYSSDNAGLCDLLGRRIEALRPHICCLK